MAVRIPDTLVGLLVPIDAVRPDPSNVMQHPPSQIDALAASLVAFGFDQPILARRNGLIIAGHGRLLAARQVGMTHVPVVYTDLDGVDAARRMIGDNRLAALAEPDTETLAELLRQLQAEDALGGTGYDDAAVDALLKEVGGATPPADDPGPQVDRAAELQAKWGTALGQVWALGEHRLVCGDCTDPAVVESVMQGERAALTFTSPPYNAGASAQLSGNTSIGDNLYRDEYDDDKTQGEYLSLLSAFTSIALSVSEYVFVNLQILAGNKRAFADYLFAHRAQLADIAIWDKSHAAPQLAQRVMDSRFEFVIVFSHGGTRAIGTRDFRGMVHNVYVGSPQRHNEYASSHAATFPLDLPEHFVSTFCNPGEVVIDSFAGTGTTLIACERLGRKCRAVELSPGYVAVTLQRWADMTGQTPRLLES